MAVMMAGCSVDILPTDDTTGAVVTFHISSGDGWDVTRSLTANGNEMSDIWLYDYIGDTRKQAIHMTSDDGDLSSPSLVLSVGTHKVRIVAANGGTPALTGDFISWSRPGDTFWTETTVTVADGKTTDAVNVTLNRTAARLRVTVTDRIPEGTASLTVHTSQWPTGVDITSGQAHGTDDYTSTATIPSSYIGTTGTLSMSVYGMSDTDEWTTDVTVTAKNSSGTSLGTVTVSDVPLKRNRVTRLSGSLFSGNRSFSVSLNDTWLDERVLTW